MSDPSVYFKGLVTILASAGLFAALAIPLILRKVPRNGIYGFRTPRTLGSDAVWYTANAFFGWALLGSSLVSAAAIVVLYSAGDLAPEAFMPSSLAALVVPLAVAILLTFLRIRALGHPP